jgi:hypothetical protein
VRFTWLPEHPTSFRNEDAGANRSPKSWDEKGARSSSLAADEDFGTFTCYGGSGGGSTASRGFGGNDEEGCGRCLFIGIPFWSK